jgi:hypothetical protein
LNQEWILWTSNSSGIIPRCSLVICIVRGTQFDPNPLVEVQLCAG